MWASIIYNIFLNFYFLILTIFLNKFVFILTAGPGILAECYEIAYGVLHLQHRSGLAHHYSDAVGLGALFRGHAARENGKGFPITNKRTF